MYREMRRKNQELSSEDCIRVLNHATSGVLAVSGDNGYPYAVPLSYVYHDSKIYFHCANTGHKLDGIKRNNKVSFCVIDQDEVMPQEYTTYYRSIIVFGEAQILEEYDEKKRALKILSQKYSCNEEEGCMKDIDAAVKQVCMIELNIQHTTGKEAIELVKMKKSKDN